MFDRRFDRLDEQIRSGLARMNDQFDSMDGGFADIRAGFDRIHALQEQCIELLTRALAPQAQEGAEELRP